MTSDATAAEPSAGGGATGTRVEFCGEEFPVDPGKPFLIGREGDIVLDENPYLHRRFLMIIFVDTLWWLSNVGSTASATVADGAGHLQAYLAPGGRLPLVFSETTVLCTAGPTTYEFVIRVDEPRFVEAIAQEPVDGVATIGGVSFTPSQHLLILALAEPLLRNAVRGTSSIPTSVQAARRLGWPITRFNRKLDNVCEKLSKVGVHGLHGDGKRLAVNRRARLVEYAVASRLVVPGQLALLDVQSSDHDE